MSQIFMTNGAGCLCAVQMPNGLLFSIRKLVFFQPRLPSVDSGSFLITVRKIRSAIPKGALP